MNLNNSQNLIDSTKKWQGAGSHKPEARSYQIDAVVACVTEFKTKSRTQCLMAPGSGKTIVSLLIKETLKPKVTIFFVPSVQLIYQQYMSWARFRKDDFDVLVVTYAKLSANHESILNALKVNHIGTTTDARDIKTFLTSKRIKKDRVIFCTYHSADKMIEACKGCEIDLAFFDEAHHVAGRFDKRAPRLLYDENIKINRRLFMTATPRLCRGDDNGEFAAGMNNPELFGDVAYTLSFQKAVKLGVLSDYQIIAAIVNKKEVSDLKIKGTYEEKIAIAATKKIFEDNIGSRGLSFHNNTKKAGRFSKYLKEVLPKETFVASADYTLTVENRDSIVDGLKKAKTGIISNVRIFGEGFDYDELDFIIMVDPKKSVTDIVQNIGRVIRKHKDKDIGTIVIPIYQEDGQISMDEALNKSCFEQIYRIATALGAIDVMLGSEIDSCRTLQGVNKPLALFVNKVKIVSEKKIEKKQVDDLMSKISMSALYKTERITYCDASVQGAHSLVEWCKKHNRLPLPIEGSARDGEGKEEFVMWRTYSQLTRPSEDVSPEIRAILESAKTLWGKSSKSAIGWRTNVSEILEYCKEHGHLPSLAGQPRWFRYMIESKKGRIPDYADEQLVKDIAIMLGYPTAARYKRMQMERHITNVAAWITEHNRVPSYGDRKRGDISHEMFASFERRKRSRANCDAIFQAIERLP